MLSVVHTDHVVLLPIPHSECAKIVKAMTAQERIERIYQWWDSSQPLQPQSSTIDEIAVHMACECIRKGAKVSAIPRSVD